MKTKTSIRLFNNKAVRARWDDETSGWWYAAVDLISAITDSKNPRVYWNALKNRHAELSTFCRQLKLTAGDGKRYNTDTLSEDGIRELLFVLPSSKYKVVTDWLKGLSDPVDEQSKRKAYELYEGSFLNDIEVGTVKGLQQIHAYLFDGLYDFAGKLRTKNISKGGFAFANCMYFDEIFKTIEAMPEADADQIIDKYVEMNIAHPFMEGNGRATRIWLDMLLKDRLKMCVDWEKIDKKAYLEAMEKSTVDASLIRKLIKSALTEKINDRELFLKGIDYSYYYEEIDD